MFGTAAAAVVDVETPLRRVMENSSCVTEHVMFRQQPSVAGNNML